MQTKHLCVLIHIWTKSEVGVPWNRFKPSSKIFYWPFQGGASFVDHLCYFCLIFVMLCASVYWCLVVTRWPSFIMSNCEVITFPLKAWVRSGAWLYRFLILALFLTYVYAVAIFYWKTLNLIYSILWNVATVVCKCNRTSYCIDMLSVTTAWRYVTSASRYYSRPSMYIRGLIPRNGPRQLRLLETIKLAPMVAI